MKNSKVSLDKLGTLSLSNGEIKMERSGTDRSSSLQAKRSNE
jgi:hypothetical protein